MIAWRIGVNTQLAMYMGTGYNSPSACPYTDASYLQDPYRTDVSLSQAVTGGGQKVDPGIDYGQFCNSSFGFLAIIL